MKPEAIEKANNKVSTLLTCSSKDDSTKQQRGLYQKFTPKQHVEVSRYTVENCKVQQAMGHMQTEGKHCQDMEG